MNFQTDDFSTTLKQRKQKLVTEMQCKFKKFNDESEMSAFNSTVRERKNEKCSSLKPLHYEFLPMECKMDNTYTSRVQSIWQKKDEGRYPSPDAKRFLNPAHDHYLITQGKEKTENFGEQMCNRSNVFTWGINGSTTTKERRSEGRSLYSKLYGSDLKKFCAPPSKVNRPGALSYRTHWNVQSNDASYGDESFSQEQEYRPSSGFNFKPTLKQKDAKKSSFHSLFSYRRDTEDIKSVIQKLECTFQMLYKSQNSQKHLRKDSRPDKSKMLVTGLRKELTQIEGSLQRLTRIMNESLINSLSAKDSLTVLNEEDEICKGFSTIRRFIFELVDEVDTLTERCEHLAKCAYEATRLENFSTFLAKYQKLSEEYDNASESITEKIEKLETDIIKLLEQPLTEKVEDKTTMNNAMVVATLENLAKKLKAGELREATKEESNKDKKFSIEMNSGTKDVIATAVTVALGSFQQQCLALKEFQKSKSKDMTELFTTTKQSFMNNSNLSENEQLQSRTSRQSQIEKHLESSEPLSRRGRKLEENLFVSTHTLSMSSGKENIEENITNNFSASLSDQDSKIDLVKSSKQQRNRDTKSENTFEGKKETFKVERQLSKSSCKDLKAIQTGELRKDNSNKEMENKLGDSCDKAKMVYSSTAFKVVLPDQNRRKIIQIALNFDDI